MMLHLCLDVGVVQEARLALPRRRLQRPVEARPLRDCAVLLVLVVLAIAASSCGRRREAVQFCDVRRRGQQQQRGRADADRLGRRTTEQKGHCGEDAPQVRLMAVHISASKPMPKTLTTATFVSFHPDVSRRTERAIEERGGALRYASSSAV